MQHAAGFLKIVDEAKANVREVTCAETAAKMQVGGVHVVDTREDREWALGHIAGAVHIGKGVIERDVEAKIPDKNAEIILYCGGGFRSVLAAENLQRMGYTNVYSMAGGWRDWAGAGLPACAACLDSAPTEQLELLNPWHVSASTRGATISGSDRTPENARTEIAFFFQPNEIVG